MQDVPSDCGDHSSAIDAPPWAIFERARVVTASCLAWLQEGSAAWNSDHQIGRFVRCRSHWVMTRYTSVEVYGSVMNCWSRVLVHPSRVTKSAPTLWASQYSRRSSGRLSTTPHGPLTLLGCDMVCALDHRSSGA